MLQSAFRFPPGGGATESFQMIADSQGLQNFKTVEHKFYLHMGGLLLGLP